MHELHPRRAQRLINVSWSLVMRRSSVRFRQAAPPETGSDQRKRGQALLYANRFEYLRLPRGYGGGTRGFRQGFVRRCMHCMGRHAASVVAGLPGRLNHSGEKVRDGIASRSMSCRTIESCRTPEGASVRVEPSVARTRRRAAHPRVPRSHLILQRLTASRVVCGWPLDSRDGPRIWPDPSMTPTPGALSAAPNNRLGARLRGDAEFVPRPRTGLRARRGPKTVR